MTVMRRGNGWSFAAWARDGGGTRRQVWRGGYRTKWDATAAERRYLVELEDGVEACTELGPTVAEFLNDWLVQSAPTRRATTHAMGADARNPCDAVVAPRRAETEMRV